MQNFMQTLLLFLLFGNVIATKKILALHGGGESGGTMESATSDLRAALGNEFEFVFPTAPYGDDPSSRIWVPDPPSKNEPTTSPDVADLSLDLLDNEVATNGPFWGIMGYSQGSAFATVYTAHAPSGTFNATILFCGYLTETHLGLLGIVNDATPFGDIPALVWMGTDDDTITNPQTTAQSQKYTNPTVITQVGGGHVVPSPGNSDPTFTQVRDWIVNTASSPAPAPTPVTSAPSTPVVTSAPSTPTTESTNSKSSSSSGSDNTTVIAVVVSVIGVFVVGGIAFYFMRIRKV